MTVERSSRVPLYYQIYEDLRRQIDAGRYRPGDQIPTEARLADAYGVSKITIKQALQLLVNDRAVERIQGKGTFVSRPKVHRLLKGVISFRDEMLQRGMKPRSRLLELSVVPAPPKVASALRLDPAHGVIKIERLRFADDEVMGLQSAYIPYDRCPGLLGEAEALESGSLYELLSTKYGIVPSEAEEFYSIARLDLRHARLMGMEEGEPCFYVERVSYLADGSPVEVVHSFLRGDRYTLHVHLVGS